MRQRSAATPLSPSATQSHVIVRTSWGHCGYFYLPYEYLTGSKASSVSSPINGAHLASDFWAIQLVSS